MEDYLFLFDGDDHTEAVWCITQEVLNRHLYKEKIDDWILYWFWHQN